jgi:beta-lactamase superfamily II metal-dependent hydrolase
VKTAGAEPKTGLLDNPKTEPENDSGTILATKYNGQLFLFTADVGVLALESASSAYELGNCHWMQIPHHGSRRNITKGLIEYFSPQYAYASASGSDRKHPRRAVVNAFNAQGARVYSTHYPTPGSLWLHRGNVPPRDGYHSATALYEANQ